MAIKMVALVPDPTFGSMFLSDVADEKNAKQKLIDLLGRSMQGTVLVRHGSKFYQCWGRGSGYEKDVVENPALHPYVVNNPNVRAFFEL